MDFAITPDSRFEMKHLGRGASGIRDRSFGESDRGSPAIDHVDAAIVSSERWKRNHHAIGRFEWKTGEVSTKAAEILSIGIGCGSFGLADVPACGICAERNAVGPAERAQVGGLAAGPNNSMRCAASQI